jgi:hypothetical protein
MSADQDLISGTGVRRHHTISASSRPLRDTARGTIAEEGTLSNEDEVVDEEWVGSVGAVGEKNASLHRQASLPTARHYTPRGVCDSWWLKSRHLYIHFRYGWADENAETHAQLEQPVCDRGTGGRRGGLGEGYAERS